MTFYGRHICRLFFLVFRGRSIHIRFLLSLSKHGFNRRLNFVCLTGYLLLSPDGVYLFQNEKGAASFGQKSKGEPKMIGNKIRILRKQRGITQVQLAEAIGISFQAVSKWENGIAFPDITLAPALASYFGVSMDELFDYNLRETEEKIEKICDHAYTFRSSDPARSREILEDGLKAYPDNDILLNNLLYVIDVQKDPDEVIRVASRLIDSTNHDDVKYDALRFLAEAYKQKGDMESAEGAIEQIPEIYFSKLSVAAWILTGKKRYEAAEKQKWLAFEDLLEMMGKIVESLEEERDFAGALAEAKRAKAVIDAMKGDTKIDRFINYAHSIDEQISRLSEKQQ